MKAPVFPTGIRMPRIGRKSLFLFLLLLVVLLTGCKEKETDSEDSDDDYDNHKPDLVRVCFNDGDGSNEYTLNSDGTYSLTGSSVTDDDCIPSDDFNDQVVPNPNSTAGPVQGAGSNSSGNVPALAMPRAGTLPALDETAPLTRALPYLPEFPTATLNRLTPNCDPAATYYSVNHTQNQLSHFATCPYGLIRTIALFSRPLQAMFTPDAKLLLVTNFDGAISFVDPSTDKVVTTLSTPGMNPSGIAITQDGGTAYVTNYNNLQPGLMIINIANRTMTGLIATPGYPKSVFLTPDGTQAWVTSIDSSSIYIVDLFTQTVAMTLNLPGYAHTGLAFNSTGTRAYVAMQPGNLYVIDTATGDPVANIGIGPVPNDVIVSRTGRRVFVSGYDMNGTLSTVDTTTNTLIGTIQVGSPASHMILLPSAP